MIMVGVVHGEQYKQYYLHIKFNMILNKWSTNIKIKINYYKYILKETKIIKYYKLKMNKLKHINGHHNKIKIVGHNHL